MKYIELPPIPVGEDERGRMVRGRQNNHDCKQAMDRTFAQRRRRLTCTDVKTTLPVLTRIHTGYVRYNYYSYYAACEGTRR